MKPIITFFLVFLSFSVSAQTWSEWFQQTKTQKKYLLQQIAALKVYIDHAQKGYAIVSDGLSVIRDIKNGDFNLHNTFFSSLKEVNHKIKKYSKVTEIISIQSAILSKSKKTISTIKSSESFTKAEVIYCNTVFNNLFNDCIRCINELILVTTSGKLEMKDDERLKRIDMLYADMQGKYIFCTSFSNAANALAIQRATELTELKYSKLINGIQ